MMVTKPRVTRCRQYSQLNRPKGLITRHFHNMAQYKCDRWARRNECSPLSPQWRSVVRPKLPKQKEPKRYPNSGTRSIKEHSITLRLPHKWSWPTRTIQKVFENYTNASNWPGAVITQDNCWTRLLRPLIWNSLLCTAVQCYITSSTGATYRKGQSISWQVQANCIT